MSREITEIEDLLCKAIAWCETSFEFLDDEGDFHVEVKKFLEQLIAKIKPILSGYAAQKQIRQGHRIALIGSVNAGKSSLFNLLVGQKRAIVTPLAGTTRDSIESTVLWPEKTITFVDTAGLRTTHDIIEQEGIARSYEQAHASDIILLIIDGTVAIHAQEEAVYSDLISKYLNKIIFIQNKADILQEKHNFFVKNPLVVSAHNSEDKKIIESEILQKIAQLSTTQELPFLINKRQFELLQTLFYNVESVLALLENANGNPHYELVSYHLKQALAYSCEITGKSAAEAALDRVFKEFCVGK